MSSARGDPRRAQPTRAQRLGAQHPLDRRLQALELELAQRLRGRVSTASQIRGSVAAVGGIPVLLEVADQRRTQVAVGLLARVRGHVLAKQRRPAPGRRAARAGWPPR